MKSIHRLKKLPTAAALVAAWLSSQQIAHSQPQDVPAPVLERGRYVAELMGCNDCHTAGYAMAAGNVPQSQWLAGNAAGFAGPWGTTYAVNLRLYMQNLSADEWVARARSLTTRPPMPWFALRKMEEGDLRAFYALVRSLGPTGQVAPAYEPPGSAGKPHP